MELTYQKSTDYEEATKSMLLDLQDRGKTYTEEELSTDLNWLDASRLVYKMKEGKDFEGDHKALAQYGIDKMSEFNYNVSMGMIPDVLDVEQADHETQVAFAYMMDAYDKKDVTLAGFGRAMKEVALDPLSYVGLTTLGAGFAAKKGTAELAKEGLKNRLHSSISSYLSNTMAVGATEGALYTAGDEVARESVYQDAGVMDEYSPENIATAGVLGAVAGAGLVKGAEVLGSQLGRGIDYINKQGEEAMAQVAGGGTPPSEYRGYHKAPMITGANTGDNLADIFPNDIYSNKAVQYYGTGDKKMDTKSIQIIQSMRNNPDKEVTIYRAVPKGVKDINDGDWITINPDYAKWHGESWVENGEYDIISKKVKASQISTNGDSIHEWGYNEGATK